MMKYLWIKKNFAPAVPLIFSQLIGVAMAREPASRLPQPILKCKTYLKQAKPHLKWYAKTQGFQGCYQSLYDQVKVFIKSSEEFPSPSSQLNYCYNLLQAVQDITGHPFINDLASQSQEQRQEVGQAAPDLPSGMRKNFSPTEGKLASPVIKLPGRERPHKVGIAYITHRKPSRKTGTTEDEEPDQPPSGLNPVSLPPSIKERKKDNSENHERLE